MMIYVAGDTLPRIKHTMSRS